MSWKVGGGCVVRTNHPAMQRGVATEVLVIFQGKDEKVGKVEKKGGNGQTETERQRDRQIDKIEVRKTCTDKARETCIWR